jgi:hypothetical protein
MTPKQINEIQKLAVGGSLEQGICKWLGYAEAFTRVGGVPPEITAAVHAIRLEVESARESNARNTGQKKKAE